MRILVVAVTVLAFVAAPAQAQMGGRRHGNDGPKTEKKAPEVDEKAYKAALERIPDPKEKYDPWGGARQAEPAKKPK
ncbi:hypothetical protein [Bradyrhizobium iriomotense]|uniref:Uncharacterized protein n=1 Tax=Bradyrhizobium iriomotense TaxID=441950 RepID=A0ABQ6BA67_9BRAD|nr:hypothetical protein [Bradyrhizobium iriomotense]GLR90731.1 hypothetical protein GCM10007857_74460 [Bradyrhizobium iriomotense]